MSVEVTRRDDRRFAAVLLGWMGVGVIVWLGIMPLQERIGSVTAFVLLAAFVLAPLALVGAAAIRAVRRKGRWLNVVIMVVAWITLLIAGLPLVRASIYLTFLAHRSAYDAVVADMKAGRLPPGVEGRRSGVAYSRVANPDDASRSGISFPWWWGIDVGQGVYYDEVECPPRSEAAESRVRTPPPAPPGQPGEASPPTIKHAGKLHVTKFHLGGHYCYLSIP